MPNKKLKEKKTKKQLTFLTIYKIFPFYTNTSYVCLLVPDDNSCYHDNGIFHY